jgi:hypothetical protein
VLDSTFKTHPIFVFHGNAVSRVLTHYMNMFNYVNPCNPSEFMCSTGHGRHDEDISSYTESDSESGSDAYFDRPLQWAFLRQMCGNGVLTRSTFS